MLYLSLLFDVTHALQCPDPGDAASGGCRSQSLVLARASMALGLAGLFPKTYPEIDQARCDAPSALPISQLETFLSQLKELDRLMKSLLELAIQ